MPEPNLYPLSVKAMDFFKSRGISTSTLANAGVACEDAYAPAFGKEVQAIAFPYFKDGKMVNIN